MTRRALALVLLAMLSAFALAVVGCQPAPAPETPAPDASEPAVSEPDTPAAEPSEVTGLQIEDITVGTGALAEPGKAATVHYTGWLKDGTEFDSSIGREPFTFQVGAGMVIPGWDQGVPGMKVGGTRRLIIPAELGYGSSGAGPIPPNATLIFEIELLSVE